MAVRRDPIRAGESTWAWMHRNAADPEVDEAIRLLQAMLDRAPGNWSAELKPRLEAKPPHAFQGAFFELALYTILSASGVDIEPILNGHGGNRPDFVVHTSRGRVLIEATVFSHSASAAIEDQTVFNSFRAAKPYLDKQGWAVWVEDVTKGASTLSPKRLARSIASELSRIDAQHAAPGFAVEATVGDPKSGWSFRVCFYRLAEADAAIICPANGGPVVSYYDSYADDLAAALQRKRHQHAAQADALVIACACNDWPEDPTGEDARRVLYGDPSVTPILGDKIRPLWSGGRIQNDPVGVILARGVWPWSLEPKRFAMWCAPQLDDPELLGWWSGTMMTCLSRVESGSS